MIKQFDGSSLIDLADVQVFNGVEYTSVDVLWFDGTSLQSLFSTGQAVDGEEPPPPPPSGAFPSFFPAYIDTTQYATTNLGAGSTASQINTALGSTKRVLLASGTYNIGNTQLSGDDNVLEGDPNGGTIIEADSGIVPIAFLNTVNEAWKDKSCSTVGAGINLITGLANTSGLTVGMWIVMNSQDIFNPKRSTYHESGEWAKITNVGSTSITVEEPFKLSFNSTPKVRYKTSVRPVGIGLKNITLRINGSGSAVDELIHLEGAAVAFCYNVRLLGDVNERAKRGISFENCIETHCYDSEASHISHEDNQGPYSNGRQGYPLYHYSCRHSYVWNFYSTRGKHAVDADMRRGESCQMGLWVYNSLAENQLLQAFSTHGGTYRSEWVDCTAINTWGGFLLRQGKGNIVMRRCKAANTFLPLPLAGNPVSTAYWTNSFPGYGSGIQLGEPLGQGGIGDPNAGLSGNNVVIEDFELSYPRISNGVNNKSASAVLRVFEESKNLLFTGTNQDIKLVLTNANSWNEESGNPFLFLGTTNQTTVVEKFGLDLSGQPLNQPDGFDNYTLFVTHSKTGITLRDGTVRNPARPDKIVADKGTGSATVQNITVI